MSDNTPTKKRSQPQQQTHQPQPQSGYRSQENSVEEGQPTPAIVSSTIERSGGFAGTPDTIHATVEYKTDTSSGVDLKSTVVLTVDERSVAHIKDVTGDGTMAEQFIPISYVSQEIHHLSSVAEVAGVPSFGVVEGQLGGEQSQLASGHPESGAQSTDTLPEGQQSGTGGGQQHGTTPVEPATNGQHMNGQSAESRSTETRGENTQNQPEPTSDGGTKATPVSERTPPQEIEAESETEPETGARTEAQAEPASPTPQQPQHPSASQNGGPQSKPEPEPEPEPAESHPSDTTTHEGTPDTSEQTPEKTVDPDSSPDVDATHEPDAEQGDGFKHEPSDFISPTDQPWEVNTEASNRDEMIATLNNTDTDTSITVWDLREDEIAAEYGVIFYDENGKAEVATDSYAEAVEQADEWKVNPPETTT